MRSVISTLICKQLVTLPGNTPTVYLNLSELMEFFSVSFG
jgi:hypothetical protein